MSNGSNSWEVPFSLISFFQNLLRGHENIVSVKRYHDILFEVKRLEQDDTLKILCVNEYVMSFTMVLEAIEEFEDLDIIYIGGNWNGYTKQAKEYCLLNRIGLYVTGEMTGALYKNDCWDYYQKDKDGDPIDRSRSA